VDDFPGSSRLTDLAPLLAGRGIRTARQLEIALATNTLGGPGLDRVRLQQLQRTLEFRASFLRHLQGSAQASEGPSDANQ
jgi:hypothetical protein